jgi:uncharacterized protein YjiS (DUF1127 family)
MHSREKEEGTMSGASWMRSNAGGAPTVDGRRRLPPAATGIGSLLARGWRAYWDWRVRRTTILILRSLDRRALHDIGIDPSEIESLVHDAGRDHRQRYDVSRPWRFGGA